jgi:hypothetical protein
MQVKGQKKIHLINQMMEELLQKSGDLFERTSQKQIKQ